MENKKANILGYIIVFAIGAAVAFGCCYFKNNQSEKNSTNENTQKEEKVCEKCPEVNCETEEKECNCPIVEEKGYMQVYYDYSPSLSYNMYGYFNHEGLDYKIIEYKGDLYSVYGNDSKSCIETLLEGKAKFSNNEYVCKSDEEETSIKKINIKSADVSKIKIYNACRSDGAPSVFIIGTNGEVKTFTEIDSRSITNNYFKGYKVKDITEFKCKNINEDSSKPVFTLLLEDGTTVTK